jgi:hypothetical protein
MIRPSAFTLLVAASLVLSAWPTHAVEELIPKGTRSTGRTETRLVPTTQSETVTGAKQLSGKTSSPVEQITGPMTKLIQDWETRTYQIPVTIYPLKREETRLITTTTTEFLRRITEQVPDGTETRYVLGTKPDLFTSLGLMAQVGIDVTPSPLSPSDQRLVFERMRESSSTAYSRPPLSGGEIELDQAAWDRVGSLVIAVRGNTSELGVFSAVFTFDKQRNFLGGLVEQEHVTNPFSWVESATIEDVVNGNAITFVKKAVSNGYGLSNGDGYGLSNGDYGLGNSQNLSNPVNYRIQATKKLIETREAPRFRTTTREEPHYVVSESVGPWQPTWRVVRGQGTTTLTTSTERVLVGQRTVPHAPGAPKEIAIGTADPRRVFKADSSAGKNSASLSGSKVRKTLGANRVTASRVSGSSQGAPRQDSANGQGLGTVLNQLLPTPKPAPTATPKPVSQLRPSEPASQLGQMSFQGAQALDPVEKAPLFNAWWFPQNPLQPPMRVTYDSYRRPSSSSN